MPVDSPSPAMVLVLFRMSLTVAGVPWPRDREFWADRLDELTEWFSA